MLNCWSTFPEKLTFWMFYCSRENFVFYRFHTFKEFSVWKRYKFNYIYLSWYLYWILYNFVNIFKCASVEMDKNVALACSIFTAFERRILFERMNFLAKFTTNIHWIRIEHLYFCFDVLLHDKYFQLLHRQFFLIYVNSKFNFKYYRKSTKIWRSEMHDIFCC